MKEVFSEGIQTDKERFSKAVELAEWMLKDQAYSWARGTVGAMLHTIRDIGFATANQYQALQNIANGRK